MLEEFEKDELMALCARPNRTKEQQRRFECLNALYRFWVKLPDGYISDTYIVYAEPSNLDGTGPMVAQLANARAAYVYLDEDGTAWLQGILHDIYPTEETAPKLVTGMDAKARRRLGL